jgi:hypothetical protein
MYSIALVNTPESPCPGTHNAACNEFMEGWRDFGYAVSEAHNLDECVGKTVLLLSSHAIDWNYLRRMNDVNPDAVYILWFYFDHIDKIPFRKYILTGEHYVHPPALPAHKHWYDIAMSAHNYVPFMLRANIAPSHIGTIGHQAVWNGCFMGSGYKHHWVYGLSNTLYHDIGTAGLLSYPEREAIYRTSLIAFGFHSDANVVNNHVTQRVFEGLAAGCVVISDNPAAADLTGGIVMYARNKEEFLTTYNNVMNDHELCTRKRNEGHEWARLYGTNRYAAQQFITKIDELWG